MRTRNYKVAFTAEYPELRPALVTEVAQRLLVVLRQWLSAEQFAEMKRSDDLAISHDFCDANMALDSALKSFGLRTRPDNQLHADFWNDVWNAAQKLLGEQS